MYLKADYSQREFDLIFNQTPTGKLMEIRNKANEILTKALMVNELLYPFDYNRFKELLKRDEVEKRQKTLFVEDMFNEYIAKKKAIGRISTSDSYKVALHSFLAFSKPIMLTDITPEFLNDYEQWMLKRNGGELTGTLGFYLRCLRTIINYAIQTGQVPKDYQYPFSKHLFTIPIKRRVKRALQRNEIETIANLTEFKSRAEETARDLWLILFYCNGINWKDLILLRWDDRIDNCFVITREKTKLTSRANPRPIRIPIIPRLQVLLDKVGKKDSPYVLGMVRDDMSEQAIMNKKKKVAKLVNQHLKAIGERLGLSVDLLTKTARDAYATSLKKKGAKIEMIAEQMGHSNTSVTQHYLDSFDDEYLMELNEMLP